MMEAITLWYRMGRDGAFAFNHISVGHTDAVAPVAVSDVQKASWRGALWRKECGWLDGINAVRNLPRNAYPLTCDFAATC